MFFYTYYQYSPLATLLSALINLYSYIAGIVGIFLAAKFIKTNIALVILGGVLIVSAVLVFIFLRKIPAKVAETNGLKNIKTKTGFTVMYCKENPDAYESLCRENPDFAAKYMLTDEGKIVKRRAE